MPLSTPGPITSVRRIRIRKVVSVFLGILACFGVYIRVTTRYDTSCFTDSVHSDICMCGDVNLLIIVLFECAAL